MQLNPYLSFNGQCKDAFAFYETCLGGKIIAMLTWADTPMAKDAPPDLLGKIAHARLLVDNLLLMGGDAPPGLYQQPKGMSVTLGCENPADAERVYKALSEGGAIQMELQETFWALKFAMFTDKFGTPWMINCERPM